MDLHTYSHIIVCQCTLWAYGGSEGVQAQILGLTPMYNLTIDYVILKVGFHCDSVCLVVRECTFEAYRGLIGIHS